MLKTHDISSSRNAALDGLRGIAIIAVFLCHSSILGPNQTESTIANKLLAVFDFGWSGVDLFFVLSGFLITDIILSTRKSQGWMKSFFIKRAFRILPIYFLFLFLLLILSYTIMSERSDFAFVREHQPYFWLMGQNVLSLINMNWPPSLFYTGHLWTLAVEWQFYMIWPFVAGRFSNKTLSTICVLVILTAVTSRIICWQLDVHISVIYTNTIARMDSIAMGALVALLLRSNIEKSTLQKLSKAFVFIGIVFVLGTFYFYGRASYYIPVMYTIGYTLLASCFAGLVFKAVVTTERTRYRAILSNQVLITIGKYSYAMYIIHLPLMGYFGNFEIGFAGSEFYGQLVFMPTMFIATFLIAMVSWKIIEGPALSYARGRAITIRSKVMGT